MIQDLVNPMDKPLFPETKTMDCTTSIELDVPDSSSSSPKTIQPSELLRDPTKAITKISLESVLSAPVGDDSSIITYRDYVERSTKESKGLSAPCKATSHGDISATDAALTEVIRTALADVKGVSDVSASSLLGRKILPNGRSSSVDSCGSMQDENSSAISDQVNKPAVSKEGTLAQDKAIEVLKALRKSGYIIKTPPFKPPRTQNSGSVASNKSEHQVICRICKKFKGRPCELRYDTKLIYKMAIVYNRQETHETPREAVWLHILKLQQNFWK